ncbi:MAG: hypothetical protein IKG66_05755 [Lachnospiraceae bacterium]|nr:hypothetical protein [Lachnospiraceae bacterium]
MKSKKTLILCLIHFVILLVGNVVALVLPSEITSSLVISVVFTDIAYLCFALTTVLGSVSDRQQAVQNIGLVTVSLLYLAAAFLLSAAMYFSHAGTKLHVVLEVVVLALGVVIWAVMYLAKMHIEEQ